MLPLCALITHNVVSLYAEPNDRSERVSQAILGDTVLLLEEDGEYARIRMTDAYEGWILRQHIRLFEDGQIFVSAYNDPLEPHWPAGWHAQNPNAYRVTSPFADVVGLGRKSETLRTKLVYGTWVRMLRLILHEDKVYVNLWLPDTPRMSYVPVETVTLPLALPKFHASDACDQAKLFLGTPYLWGGTTPFGFDCSGFVQRIYGMLGVTLPRDAYLQAKSPLGDFLPPGKPLRAGDLVFFCADHDPRGRGITHVGMALNGQYFIHASGKLGVDITPLNDPYYARTYRGAWRYRAPA